MSEQLAPPSGTRGDSQQTDPSRPESGVFLSPQTSDDQSRATPSEPRRAEKTSLTDPEYHTSTSSTVPDLMTSSATESRDDFADVLFESGSQLDNDWLPSDGAEDDDDTAPSRPSVTSDPIEIPSAFGLHSVHEPATRMMDSTPPRSYITHPISSEADLVPGLEADPVARLETDLDNGLTMAHRFSTGCLTNLPHLVKTLTERPGRQYISDLLATGLRVTTSKLNTSSRRAEVHCKRTASESSCADDVTVSRDRSQSAPDIGRQRLLIQRQCAQELRRISDDFNQKFEQKGRTTSRGCGVDVSCADSTSHSSSYPGTSQCKPGLWQAIVQSLSPDSVRPASTPASRQGYADELHRKQP